VGVGIWLRVDESFRQFLDVDNEFNFIFSAAYIMLSVGVVVVAVGGLGVCGAVSHNVCILATVCITCSISFHNTRDRASSIAAERVWNTLSPDVRSSSSL